MAKLRIFDSHFLYIEYVIQPAKRIITVGYEEEFNISLPSLLSEEPTLTVTFYDNEKFSEIKGLIKWLEENININFNDLKSRYYIETDDCSDCIEFFVSENHKLNIKLCLVPCHRDAQDYLNLYDIDVEDVKLFLEELKKEAKTLYGKTKSSDYWGYKNNEINKNNNVTKKDKTSKKYGIKFERK